MIRSRARWRGLATRWNCILLIRGSTCIVEMSWRRPRPRRGRLERGAAPVGAPGQDARVHAHVLGEEDSRVDGVAGRGLSDGALPERHGGWAASSGAGDG